jgi:hypothetical protein
MQGLPAQVKGMIAGELHCRGHRGSYQSNTFKTCVNRLKQLPNEDLRRFLHKPLTSPGDRASLRQWN